MNERQCGRPDRPDQISSKTSLCLQYNVSLDQLGAYTVLPPLAQVFTGSVSGVLADRLIQQGYSVKSVRRYLQVQLHSYCYYFYGAES